MRPLCPVGEDWWRKLRKCREDERCGRQAAEPLQSQAIENSRGMFCKVGAWQSKQAANEGHIETGKHQKKRYETPV